jgi:hypothetical protein
MSLEKSNFLLFFFFLNEATVTTIKNCVFNITFGSGGTQATNGGAIYIKGSISSNFSIDNTQFTNFANASFGGALCFGKFVTLTISSCSFVNCSSTVCDLVFALIASFQYFISFFFFFFSYFG